MNDSIAADPSFVEFGQPAAPEKRSLVHIPEDPNKKVMIPQDDHRLSLDGFFVEGASFGGSGVMDFGLACSGICLPVSTKAWDKLCGSAAALLRQQEENARLRAELEKTIFPPDLFKRSGGCSG